MFVDSNGIPGGVDVAMGSPATSPHLSSPVDMEFPTNERMEHRDSHMSDIAIFSPYKAVDEASLLPRALPPSSTIAAEISWSGCLHCSDITLDIPHSFPFFCIIHAPASHVYCIPLQVLRLWYLSQLCKEWCHNRTSKGRTGQG